MLRTTRYVCCDPLQGALRAPHMPLQVGKRAFQPHKMSIYHNFRWDVKRFLLDTFDFFTHIVNTPRCS